MQRINRALADENRALRVTRGERAQTQHGRYHVVNYSHNLIEGFSPDLTLEDYAKEFEVLADYETVEEEE